MKLTLLGTGTPFIETERSASAVLLRTGKLNLLFDAGRGVNTQLLRAGLSPADIDVIFITHHHWDHIGDLGDLLLGAWHAGRQTPLHVYGPPGTQAIIDALLSVVFQREIAFSLKLEPQLGSALVPIFEIIRVHESEPGLVMDDVGCRIYTTYVNHGSTLMSQEDWPCLGYRIETAGQTVAISGDTIVCDELEKLTHNADILVQCCYLAEAEITSPALAYLAQNVIASSGQLGKMAARAQVKTLILTHFRPKSDMLMQSIIHDIRQHYNGEIILGMDLLRTDLLTG